MLSFGSFRPEHHLHDFIVGIALVRGDRSRVNYSTSFTAWSRTRWVRDGFAYGGQRRRGFQEQYGVLETIEKVEEADNACSRATKKTVRVLQKPGASPLLFASS